jgi:hypothetical protein
VMRGGVRIVAVPALLAAALLAACAGKAGVVRPTTSPTKVAHRCWPMRKPRTWWWPRPSSLRRCRRTTWIRRPAGPRRTASAG